MSLGEKKRAVLSGLRLPHERERERERETREGVRTNRATRRRMVGPGSQNVRAGLQKKVSESVRGRSEGPSRMQPTSGASTPAKRTCSVSFLRSAHACHGPRVLAKTLIGGGEEDQSERPSASFGLT